MIFIKITAQEKIITNMGFNNMGLLRQNLTDAEPEKFPQFPK